MSSERFEGIQDDLESLIQSLKQKVNDRISKCGGEERKRLVREVEKGVEEGNILIQEIEGEVKVAPPSFRTQMLSTVRNYRRQLDQVGRELRQANSSFGSVNSSRNEFEDMTAAQRGRLLQGTESLNRTSQSIGRSHRIAAETDQIGTEIIDELGTQRESLIRTRDRLEDTHENLSRSRRILNTMNRRLITNKLLLIVIILVEIIILGVLIYWKFFMKKK
ncbi:unnamed protein product [Owenia fusiformis]|uniref:Uncharacterized protein n=1 Tax=Owenia fusiformis TaxID=6347 RepID=A0A8J1U7F1_OWEFU|nr:unnamed protein product [Owenia fusiformis]